MMDKLYSYLADKMIARGIVASDDRDVVVYGLDMIIYTIASLSALVCLGAVFNLAMQTTLLLLLEIPIQSLGGGYHARTHLKCFLWMIAFWGLCMMLYAYMPSTAVYFLSIPALIILMIFTPVEHVNAQASIEKKRKMRKYLLPYLCIVAVSELVLAFYNPNIAKIISLAIFDCGISVAMGLFSKDTVKHRRLPAP